jgi:hypothetical protein
MAIYAYKIAAGHNNAGSLVNIESITPSGDRHFFPPEGFNNFNPGQANIRGDGLIGRSGSPSCFWVFSAMTRKQVAYLRTTYCNGGYSGFVTIATRPDTIAYANYNAVMILPDPDATNRHFLGYEDYRIQFTQLVAL